MKIILTIIFILSGAFAMPVDKIYTFGSYEQDEKENKVFISKISAEKTFDISDTSFAFVEGIVSRTNKSSKSNNNFIIRELYYDKYFLQELLNIRLGRSVRTFDFTNTYSIVDFLSLSSRLGDINDRTLSQQPLDGLSLTLNDIRNETMNQYISLHIYGDKRIKQRYLLEMTQSGDNFHQSIFLYTNSDNSKSIAIAKSETIGDNIIYNLSTKYDFGDKSAFSSVVGMEYSPMGDLLIGLEGINLGKNINGRFERAKKHNTFRSANDFKNYYSDLTSKNYLSLYTTYTIDDTRFLFGWLENVNDSSRRLSLQLNHKFESIELNIQGIKFDGIKDTEFGYIKEQKAYEIKFFLSYLLVY